METKDVLLGLRTKRGLTQEELAQEVYVTRQAVSRWENGETIPNIEALKQLSKFFDVSINTLLGSKRQLVCQCCGMPLDDSTISKDPNGDFNEEAYLGTEAVPMDENWPAEQVRAHMEAVVPNLRHWKDKD